MSTKRKFKLIAIDLDGTLIDDRLTVAPRVKEALAAAQAQGVTVTLASGRMFKAMKPFAQELNIKAPLICYQGGLVRHPLTEETTFHLAVPVQLAQEAVSLARELGIQINAFIDDRLHVETMTAEAEAYMRLARVEATVVDDLVEFLQDNPSTKLVFVNLDENKTDRLVEELTAHFEGRLGITKSHAYYTEAIHPDVSKGRALTQLAEALGVSLDEVMGIGDNLNDLSLVQTAGFGVAMGNGAPRVKAAADFVSATFEEDGVAVAIEKYVLRA
jgi:hypothetical protein